jgi:hypothetical protein
VGKAKREEYRRQRAGGTSEPQSIRKDLFIFGGGAVLTALGITHASNALLWSAVFWGGVILMVFSAIDGLARKASLGTKLRIAINALAAAILSACILFIYVPRDERLPGFTGYAVIRLYDTPESRRRYVFEFVSSDGAKASFYLSASSLFTFSITDVRGESYPLEIKVGTGGLPIDQFVALFCEVGVDKDSTTLRVLANEREIARRDLGFPINLGKMDWKAGALGAPANGINQGGIFLLSELGAYAGTMTTANVHALVENVRGFYKQPFE